MDATQRWTAGEDQWLRGIGRLRDLVRQELVFRQLSSVLPPPPLRILDVGFGQGSQLRRLAGLGHQLIGVDASARMVEQLTAAVRGDPVLIDRVSLSIGDASELGVADSTVDTVLCHGVLMYVEDPMPVLAEASRVLKPGGLLSLLVRNADALALRPGLSGDWVTALAAFDGARYENRLGIDARADRRLELEQQLLDVGIEPQTWFGVRLFTDLAAGGTPAPDASSFEVLLAAEERAGRTDPYRGVAALTHLIGRKNATGFA